MYFQIPTALHVSMVLSMMLSTSVASKGCGKPLATNLQPGGPSVNFTLNSIAGGGERRYLLHLPENFSKDNNKPAPLFVAFHAFGQTASSMENITRFSEPDTNKDYIVVYPEGINNVWVGDPGAPNSSVIDDRPFINDLLDTLESTLCIDKARIYTTGFSNGGGLSGLLACYPLTAERIAAFSGVSAAYYTKESLGYPLFDDEACNTGNRSRPIPFLDIHGDSDGVIAYDGDSSGSDIDQNGIPDPDTLPIPQWLGDWVKRNGCSSPTCTTGDTEGGIVNTPNQTTWLENGTVQKSAWTCDEHADAVVGYYVKGLGHGWPSTIPLDGILEEYRRGPTSWNASAVLLDWFARWSLPISLSSVRV